MMLVAVAMLALTSLVRAEDELPIPADEYVYCTVCHGVQLMGNSVIKAPRLSGMESWYVENQLRAFKKGWRGKHESDLDGMEMQPMAAALSDEQIKEVSAFVAATRSDAPPGTITGDADKGSAHYYLVTQMRNFRDGARGSHAGDTYGMQMRASARLLPDDEAIRDVVTYILTLQDQ